jgi:hypothetical protein
MSDVEGKRFLRSGEVEKVLRRTRKQIRVLVKNGRLKGRMQSGQWRYPVGDVRALALELGVGREDEGTGRVEAAAIALIREGRSDGLIVEKTSLPLREVERLRLSLGLTPTADVAAAAARAQVEEDEDEDAAAESGGGAITRAHASVARIRARLESHRLSARARAYGEGTDK